MSVEHPKVFISYSHDSEAHRDRVLRLSERLRVDGFETMLDRYVEGTPPQGWPRWMLNQIDWAEYILFVCTQTYYRRFRGHDVSGVGKGVDWEGALITNELYDQKSVSNRFVPVLFDAADVNYIPEPLRAFSHHLLTSDQAYAALTDYLANAAGIAPAPLGPPPNRQRPTGSPLVFESGNSTAAPSTSSRGSAPDLSAVPAPGGTMSADDKFYIERAADRSAKDAAKRRCETIVIKGPRQFGKSSLLAHYVAQCRAAGKLVASVDFSGFEEGIVADYGRFLTTLATQLARRLRQSPPAGGYFRTQHGFLTFLENSLLRALAGPLVFAFDETDRIMRQGYAQDFFSMVRMWHNYRADPGLEWHKVGLALASSSEPKLFIKDAVRSPFNVGLRLPIDLFSVAEAAELNRRYGSPLSPDECARLHRLVGGHPFLTQDAYYQLYGPDPLSFHDLEAQAAKDDGPFGEHLRAMLSNLQGAEGLLAALQQVIRDGTVPRKDDYYRLEGAGLVQRENGRIAPTTQIYADFFRATA